jgi:hypothetical protein
MVNITVLRENRIRFVNKRSEVIDMASLFFMSVPCRTHQVKGRTGLPQSFLSRSFELIRQCLRPGEEGF